MEEEDEAEKTLLGAVGTRIRKARQAAGMTQQQVAAATGHSQGFVWRVEAGKQNVELRTLGRFALTLSTSLEALVKGVPLNPEDLPRRAATRSTTKRAEGEEGPSEAERSQRAADPEPVVGDEP